MPRQNPREVAVLPLASYDPLSTALRALARAAASVALDDHLVPSASRAVVLEGLRDLQMYESVGKENKSKIA